MNECADTPSSASGVLLSSEPRVSVGLLTDIERVHFSLEGEFRTPEGQIFPRGEYQAVLRAIAGDTDVEVTDAQGQLRMRARELSFTPTTESATFSLSDVLIGRGFHWEQRRRHRYAGTMTIRCVQEEGRPRLVVINEIPLEAYVLSVVSSEMNARAPREFLKAHVIISRSWLLAMRARREIGGETSSPPASSESEIIRWEDRTIHRDFDVCADDHCQRYYGLPAVGTPEVQRAVAETRGHVLCFAGEVCDARFSKCCGGATEEYRSAWEDRDVPYLRGGRFDGEAWPAEFPHPLTREDFARAWIEGSPPAYCNVSDPSVLEDILPESDLPTHDFFRWERTLTQDELQARVRERVGLDLGAILQILPEHRGTSGRVVRLRLVGERGSVIVGKELEIRRLLAPTTLYSSALLISPEEIRAGIPRRFRLRGAGWGHGVGLCQIGAAMMAQRGKTYREILAHYYAPAEITCLYT